MDARHLQTELGCHLRQRRVDLAKTQAEVAEHVGLTRSSISNVEAGNQALSLNAFVELAHFLQVRPGELLDDVCGVVEDGRMIDLGLPDKYRSVISRSYVAGRALSAGK